MWVLFVLALLWCMRCRLVPAPLAGDIGFVPFVRYVSTEWFLLFERSVLPGRAVFPEQSVPVIQSAHLGHSRAVAVLPLVRIIS